VDKSAFSGELRDRVFALEPGDISEPIKSEYGYHIFKCSEKRGNTMRLSHILIAVRPTPEDTARALNRAKKVMEELKKGADYDALVQKYSDDTATRDLGGDLGWMPLDALPPEIVNAVNEMKPGDVRGPILAGLGYHIIKLLDIKKGGKPSFEEISSDIQNILYQRKLDERLKKLIKRLKKKYYVKKYI